MNIDERKRLAALFERRGYAAVTWIDPRKIVVSHWVRMKCMFGCDEFGRNASCPPNTLTVADCRRFFDEYRAAAVFHFRKKAAKPERRKVWAKKVNEGLLALEREVFLEGYHKAFLVRMDSCSICASCAGGVGDCRNPKLRRPTPEGMAVDVFATVRRLGLPIEVLTGYSQTMNRYAFLLVE